MFSLQYYSIYFAKMAFLLNGKADVSMDYFEDTLFNVRGFFYTDSALSWINI